MLAQTLEDMEVKEGDEIALAINKTPSKGFFWGFKTLGRTEGFLIKNENPYPIFMNLAHVSFFGKVADKPK